MTAGGGASWLARLRPDTYILLILGMVVLATFLPAQGSARPVLDVMVSAAIALVFFLHGARLSREAVIAGATQWRLHILVLLATFAIFPALGVAAASLPAWLLPASLTPGVIFLACYIAYTAYLIFAATQHDLLPAFSAIMLWFVIPITVVTLAVVSIRFARRPQTVQHS